MINQTSRQSKEWVLVTVTKLFLLIIFSSFIMYRTSLRLIINLKANYCF